jgi:ParB family chromosome partitioning protein
MATDAKSKRGLGRGLNALFEDEENFAAPAENNITQNAPNQNRSRMTAMIAEIYPNPDQPRRDFDEDALNQLAESLKSHGMIQPIVVQKIESPKGRYRIVAGERRWRAAQLAQLHEAPISIVELSEEDTLEVALIENLQREDLNPVEEALGYSRLINDHKRTQEQVAKAIGKSRPHVANTIRLLNLPPFVIDRLRDGTLTAGHARTLVNAPDAEKLAREIIEKGLNVRAAESLISKTPEGAKRKHAATAKDVDTVALENDMSNMIGMRVTIDSKDGKRGVLKVEFKTLNQLDELIERLTQLKTPKLAD